MARKPKTAEPTTGHNSGEMTGAERKAIFMHHYGPIAAQLEVVKEAQAEYKKLRKLAKADKIVLADIDYALRCAEVEDPAIIPAELKRRAEIAAWFALPVEYQPDMFGNFDREPSVDRAAREGRAAGASGIGTNPYDENSAQGRAWAKEWAAEQKTAREAFQSAMEKRNTTSAPAAADPEFPDPVNQNEPASAAAE